MERHPELEESGVYVGDILGALLRRWPLVLVVTGIFTAAGLAYALFGTPWYRAEVQLLPRDDKPGTGLSSQLAQLGGLAGLAGINLGSSGKEEPMAVLRSQGFARRFIEKNDLVVVLLADEWDAKTGQWKDRRGPEPDIRDAVREFERTVRRISEDRKLGLVTVSIEWKDPEVAASWANKMVDQVNDELRARALDEAETNVRYLQEQMRQTDLLSLQQSIGRLLESELQKLMLARGKEDFAFRIIDGAEPPKRQSRPKRAVVVLGGFTLGLLVSLVGVFAAASAGRSRPA